ncbi:ABC transporter permease [Rhizobium sp. ICMP 5592]|uniref:ABC transporter permease n=1 Tax=Rhizobium sp. ICMP 5592 TaxID=2292445 RepID=UPI0012956540|nr:ABC transporter permease [Rhizobium sp. ICMP 5592]MQB45910.1 ABC transporter permease [Rhizobium sp. ICMP 5592]
MTRRLRLHALQILVGVGVLAIWAGANALNLTKNVLPPVTDVGYQFFAVLVRPEFIVGFGATVYDAARGLLIAALLAIPAGILIGMFPKLEVSTRVLVDFGRSFPVIALLPVLVLLFGATQTMKVVAIAIACFFPILLQTIYGARNVDPTIIDTVRSFRIPPHLRFFKVLLPAAGPFIATGLRIATTVSILVAVGVEIVSVTPGIGREIALSRSYNETPTTFAYIIYTGLLGVMITLLWDLTEARLLRWHIRSKLE